MGSPTNFERLGELESVDELGVKARGNLDAHTSDEEEDVHPTKVGLLVPRHLVTLDEAGDDRVRGISGLHQAHCGGSVGWRALVLMCRRFGSVAPHSRRPKELDGFLDAEERTWREEDV